MSTGTDTAIAVHLGLSSICIGFVLQGTLCWTINKDNSWDMRFEWGGAFDTVWALTCPLSQTRMASSLTGKCPISFWPQPHHGEDGLVTAQFHGRGLDQLSLERSTSLSFPACVHPQQHSVSRLDILFSGGLKDGLRHLRNSWKLSFQSAFSSDSSMRASTQRPLKQNTGETPSAGPWLLP